MARRSREKPSDILFQIFLNVPWWVGPITAFFVSICFVLLSFLFSESPNPFFKLIAGAAIPLGFGAAVLILAIWIFSLIARAKRLFLFRSSDSIDRIRDLSWRDFEQLVGEMYRQKGYFVEEFGGSGADGGIDLVATAGSERILIQCKRWKAREVGVSIIREMFGVLIAEKATRVDIVTSGRFTRDAQDFAVGKPITLIDGEELSRRLSTESPTTLPTTNPAIPQQPNCPKCGSPMVLRTAKRGDNAGNAFFGCSRYPACRGTQAAV